MDTFIKKKSLGQHFLNDANIAAKIAAMGSIEKGDIVLEIGPGTGFLTRELLALGATVVAVEADTRAIDVLNESFAREVKAGALIIHSNDIREVSFNDLGLVHGQFKIISNIPYYISGLLFRLALSGKNKPSRVVFLVQKEVAERIVRSKKESLLSLSIKVYGDPSYAFTVRRGSFTPSPKVDSAVVIISAISRTRLGELSDEDFFEVLRHGFASRRKQLFGCLKGTYTEEQIIQAFTTMGIGRKARGEDLSIDMWIGLAKSLVIPAI